MAAYTTQMIVKDTIVHHFIEKNEQAHIVIHIGMHQHKSNTPMAEPFQLRAPPRRALPRRAAFCNGYITVTKTVTLTNKVMAM